MIRKMMIVLALCAGVALPAAAQTPAPTADEANALFQAQKWEDAAAAYQTLTKADPSKGINWFRLGFALNSLGRYQQGADAFQKAIEIGHRPEPMYALSQSYAQLKDKDHAFEWLNKAIENNLPQPRRVRNDPNLASLRDDPRFAALLALAEKKARVCMNIPEYRQFDFWVGEWDVLNPAGQQLGVNKIVLLQDGCIVEENWTSASGGTGQSFNFYNPVTKKWHQSYMDGFGNNWMMDGEFKDNALYFEGAVFTPNSKTLVKVTFTNMGPDKLRQYIESSTDNGQTWTPSFDGRYVRKKS